MFEMISDFYMTYAEHLITIVLAACVFCAALGKKWNWPIGLVGVVMYGMHAWFIWGLYADALLQIFYFATGALGWYWWYKGGNNKTEAKVVDLRTVEKWGLWILIIITAIALTSVLKERTDSTVPALDAFTTVTCMFAQLLLMMRNRFTWVLWIVADIVYVYMFYVKGLNFLAVEYAIFTLNAAFGYWMWTRLQKAGK
ncbi:MAG: nicotinamide riboside transporter PnuC [Aeromonas popoffii]|uniref:nicotinamide riboside transporter PnuC n=1 Tax=Aeromonas popoffii TaxID=70856 RepID=UPI003F36C620